MTTTTTTSPPRPRKLLDVPRMLRSHLANYDRHVDVFVRYLVDRLECQLVYLGPEDMRQHFLRRTTYACSIRCGQRTYRNVFPVMVGSLLDLSIRHRGQRTFCTPLSPFDERPPFRDLDIIVGHYVVLGQQQSLPHYYTNDPAQMHRDRKGAVRVYNYDASDRGRELRLYVREDGRGDLVVRRNDNVETREGTDTFFDFCPHRTDSVPYMNAVFHDFDIDSLANKIFFSSGHVLHRLCMKYLCPAILGKDWSQARKMCARVVKSIDTGNFLHVLSRRTNFKTESGMCKLDAPPQERPREFGANGEVYADRSVGCYRELTARTYPINPYQCHVVMRLMSSKVNEQSVPATHRSHRGFLCILGCWDPKHVGRSTMMVRETEVSVCFDLDPVYGLATTLWKTLGLRQQQRSGYHVVVNSACVPVTESCFRNLDLLALKREYRLIECYRDDANGFVVVRYKSGLLFRRLVEDVWVTAADVEFWKRELVVDGEDSYDSVTSHLVDLNPYFMHNAFPKNVLAFNALKNAVLAPDDRYHRYFLEGLSAFARHFTPYHRPVLDSVDDGVSEHFVMWMPCVRVAYMSYLGCTQEDGIVCRRESKVAFDCVRFYTVRVKMAAAAAARFHPEEAGGGEGGCLGTIVCTGTPEPQSPHVQARPVGRDSWRLFFCKTSSSTSFRVSEHHLVDGTLSVCVEWDHPCATGDKLCSLHGQKGVIRVMDSTPLLDGSVRPDLLVGPYGNFRMTLGQIHEAIANGGRDATRVQMEEEGGEEDVPCGDGVFCGPTFYMPITFWADEHIYAPDKCTFDKITCQPVKGRSRGGAMRIGNMENTNGLQGNGLAACAAEKCGEDSDFARGQVPVSVNLVNSDAACLKAKIEYEYSANVTELLEFP